MTLLHRLGSWRHRWLAVVVVVAFVSLLAAAAEARVGGGSSYSGSRRSSNSDGGGGGGGALFFLIELLFSALPWPLKLILVGIVLFVIFKSRNSGATLTYDANDNADDNGSAPPFVPFGRARQPRHGATLAPSWAERGRAIDPSFCEVLFLERAVMLLTRLYEAAPRKPDLEALAPYVAADVAQLLSVRSVGVSAVRGVVVGRILPVDIKASTTAEGAVAVAVRVRVQINRHLETQKGPQSFYSHEEWSFVRAVGAAPRGEDTLDRFGCPGCGSPLERDTFGRCLHCATSLQPGAADWSVRAVRVLEEESRGPLLTSSVEEVGTDAPTAKDDDVDQQIATLLPGPKAQRFLVRAKEIFTNLQTAWTARDLAGLRPFETDSLWQSHRFWIDEYLRQDLRNVIDQLAVRNIEICRVERDGDYIAAVCRIHASCLDYVVEDKTKKRVSGSPVQRRSFTEYWTFVKHHDAKGSTDLRNCPSCGAKLSIGAAGTCEYCQSKITLGRFDWVASRIEQDEEIVAG